MDDHEWAPAGVDLSQPSVARVYDYLLGGKDNFAVDRQVAKMALEIAPDGPLTARANRRFLQRVVRFLAAECGIRQFLDLGSGLPTAGNVHEVAQAIDPAAKVVYVDHDPIVLAHGRALLADTTDTVVIQADIREPEAVLTHRAVREHLDFSQPIGLLLFAILHHLNDDDTPAGVTARLVEPLAPGSHVAVSHFCNPGTAQPELAAKAEAGEKLFNERLGTGRWRRHHEIMAYLDGLELLDPGLVPLPLWRPDPGESEPELPEIHYTFVGGVARRN